MKAWRKLLSGLLREAENNMNISVIGTGYVGLVQAVGLAYLGYKVTCLDIDPEKIEQLRRGQSPIYEPGLQGILEKVIREGKISFTLEKKEALANAKIIFVAVGTPSKDDGSAEMKFVQSVIKDIIAYAQSTALVVIKSTVALGTNEQIQQQFIDQKRKNIVVSNPEFLREGTAMEDFLRPDRVVIGSSSQEAARKIAHLYRALEAPVLVTDFASAELIKYASNSLLALEISYINSIAILAERVGADVTAISRGMRLDKRIGEKAFLHAGIGYGGSCFPKDVKALINIGQESKADLPLLRATDDINQQMSGYVLDKITKKLGKITGKKIALWGLSFKPNTDDIRESPALAIANKLIDKGAEVFAYDPIVKKIKGSESIRIAKSALAACQGADALVIATDWPEFATIALQDIAKSLSGRCILDGRNILDPNEVKRSDLDYLGIGRGIGNGYTVDILEG